MYFFFDSGRALSQPPAASSLFERAQEEIYRLNFDRAYGLLSQISKRHLEPPPEEKIIILKNIVSLGQTFSNLRLFSAYHRGCSRYKEEETADSLSPFSLLDSHRSEYSKRTRKWLKRLRSDIKETSKISQEVELSLKYPGTEELPYFVKAGIDTLQNIKEGIPPTPSQAQNIEEFESYSAVLAVISLCVQEAFQPPRKTMIIKAKVLPERLSYHSKLWIDRASDAMGPKEERVERVSKSGVEAM